ncbi:MAG: oligosaccharide flippase family protein [Bacteroidetes bacterium]|nr:oligosaccharide flippase family protein [Bacteroidota bacterium]
MGIVLRQSIKGSITQYFGILVGYVNLLYVIPYCLSPEYNGLLRLVLETATFFALFAQAGVPNAIPRFGPEFRSIGKERLLMHFSLLVPFMTTTAFSILYFLFFRDIFNKQLELKSPLFLRYEFWLIPITLSIVYQNVLENLIANYYRITVSKLVREVFLRLGLTAVSLITIYKTMDLSEFLGMISVVYLAGALILLAYLLLISKKNKTYHVNSSGKAPWGKIGTFMALILISGLGTNLVNKLDIFMVSSQIGLTENAIYSTAFLITMVMEVPSRSFQQIMAPIVSEAIHYNNTRKISWAYKKSSSGQTLASLIIFSVLLLNAQWIFSSMPDSKVYSLGYVLIIFLGLAKLFDAFTGINGLILANSKYYYVGIYFTIALAILAILLNLAFIPRYGLNGVAYSTALSIFLYNLILLLFVWYRFKVHPFSASSLKLIMYLALSASIILIQYFTGNISFISSFLFSTAYVGLLFLLLLRIPILREIKMMLNRLLTRF